MDEKMSPEMIGILILEEIKGMRADMKQELAAIRMEFASYAKSNEQTSQKEATFMDLTQSIDQDFDTEEAIAPQANEVEKAMIDHEYTSSKASQSHSLTIHVHNNENNLIKDENNTDEVDMTDDITPNYEEGQPCENDDDYLPIIPKAPDAYKCTICGIVLRYKGNLVRHMKIHVNEKPFSCSVCYKAFRDRYELATHARIHSKDRHLSGKKRIGSKNNTDKSYMCSVCGSIFSQPGNLRRHLGTHTNERPFSCEVCNNNFRRKDDKVRHLASKKHIKKVAEREASEIGATEEIAIGPEKISLC